MIDQPSFYEWFESALSVHALAWDGDANATAASAAVSAVSEARPTAPAGQRRPSAMPVPCQCRPSAVLCADCVLISDASLVALARLAPQLRDLNLYHCEGTTPAGCVRGYYTTQ